MYIKKEGKKKEKETKSRPQHTTLIDNREKNIIATVVWNLIPPNIFPSTKIQLDIDFNFAVKAYIKRLEKQQLKIWKKNQASIKC